MKIFWVILCMAFVCTLNAQSDSIETKILWKGKGKVKVFAAGMSQVNMLEEQIALYLGSGVALSIENKFFMGAYFLRQQSAHNSTTNHNGINGVHRFETHHQGLWLGYIIKHHKLLHPTVDLCFGSGYVRYYGDELSSTFRSNPYFMISPSLGAEANLTEFLKIQLKGGYQLCSNFAGGSVGQDDLFSPFLNLGLRLGWF